MEHSFVLFSLKHSVQMCIIDAHQNSTVMLQTIMLFLLMLLEAVVVKFNRLRIF